MPPAVLDAHLVLEAERVAAGHFLDRLAQKNSADHATEEEEVLSPLAGKKIKAVEELCNGIRLEMLDTRPLDALFLVLQAASFSFFSRCFLRRSRPTSATLLRMAAK